MEQCIVLLQAGSIVTTVGTRTRRGTITVGIVALLTEVASFIRSTVVLTSGTASRTLTETSAITTISTGGDFDPSIAFGVVGTLLVVATRAAIGIGLTSITNRCGGACVGVGSHTAIGTVALTPGAVFSLLLVTGVDIPTCTA